MLISRRGILKSMMAGSALAAYALPRFSFADTLAAQAPAGARELVLVTAGAGERFALAVRAAGHAESLALGPGLPGVAALHTLFAGARGKRLVGLMPDAAYVLFSELARDAGVATMFEGRHMTGADSASHALHCVPGFQGVGRELAGALVSADSRFAITEVPLGATGAGRADASLPGFASYRVGGVAVQDELWLHLSGLDLAQGCEALGIEPGQAEALRRWPGAFAPPAPASGDWERSLGVALARLASGSAGAGAPCVKQAFIHQLPAQQDDKGHDSLVSFLMQA